MNIGVEVLKESVIRVQYQEDYRPYSRHKTMASASEIAAEGSRVNFFTIKARKCERWKI